MTNTTTSDSVKITEYPFVSEGLAPCAIFTLLGYYGFELRFTLLDWVPRLCRCGQHDCL